MMIDMKLLKPIAAGILILLGAETHAQVSINVNINAHPSWGPSVTEAVRYYYLPEVNVYYDIHTAMFIYVHNGHWIHRRHLPDQFSHYNLHRGPKIIVYDYRGSKPYIHCKYHRKSYRMKCEREHWAEDRCERDYRNRPDRRGKGDGKDHFKRKERDRDDDRSHGKKKNKEWNN